MTKETPTLVQIDSTNGENQTMANGCTDFICKFDLRSTALILLMSLLYFVIEILAYGMVYVWLEPKVNSITNITQLYGTSDGKWYAQANHLAQLRALLEDVENKQRYLIRDRGYIDNEYIRVEG
jgi:hypothetical protein